jgi:hypothetical protein
MTETSTVENSAFPLNSLQEFLMPNTILKLKTFKALSLGELEVDIGNWASDTLSIICIPSQISEVEEAGNKYFVLSVTYVPAKE